MAGAAILSVTLVPILMGWLIRGKIPAEQANPLNRWLTGLYRPAIDWTLQNPKQVLLIAVLIFATTAWPLARLGGEFLPNLDEGDLLYMPSAPASRRPRPPTFFSRPTA
jgi:Cu(I)/Ag(I) efflux system membrane protein CusA/SilA